MQNVPSSVDEVRRATYNSCEIHVLVQCTWVRLAGSDSLLRIMYSRKNYNIL